MDCAKPSGASRRRDDHESYVVMDVVERLRERFGVIHADQWREFLEACGLTLYMLDLPPSIEAVVVDTAIILNTALDPRRRSELAFHEVAHYWLHAGNLETFWRHALSGAQGELTVAKFERQANDFARLFPVWDDA